MLQQNQQNLLQGRGQDLSAQHNDQQAQAQAQARQDSIAHTRVQDALRAGQINRQLAKELLGDQIKLRELDAKEAERAEARLDKQAGKFDSAVDKMFITADGKQDAAQAAAFKQFIGQSNLKVDGKPFTSMTPTEQLNNLAKARQMFDLTQRQNAAAGIRTDQFTPIVGSKNGFSLGDVLHGDAGITDYVLSNTSPFRKHNVLVDRAGRPFLARDLYYNQDGSINGDLASLAGQSRKLRQ